MAGLELASCFLCSQLEIFPEKTKLCEAADGVQQQVGKGELNITRCSTELKNLLSLQHLLWHLFNKILNHKIDNLSSILAAP